MKDIAIFGAGGFGKEVKTLIDHINRPDPIWNFIGFFDDEVPFGSEVQGSKVIGDMAVLNTWDKAIDLVVAVGNPVTRNRILGKVHNTKVGYATLVHPSVIIGDPGTVTIGEGTMVCAGAIITTSVDIGKHAILNLNVTVGHDSILGNGCSLMPGVNVAGNVKIGDHSFVGSGANIINNIVIGDYVNVGAGSLVNHDVPEKSTAVGVPARIIKKESEC